MTEDLRGFFENLAGLGAKNALRSLSSVFAVAAGFGRVSLSPLGGLNTTLTHTSVIHLRLDYLLHALMFAPLVVLWRLSFPHHPLRLIILAGLALALGLEGIQYLLPYRAWNVNDAIGNGIGVFMGVGLMRMRQDRSLMKAFPTPEIRFPRH